MGQGDYETLFGYLYWLTGSRSAALDVARQAAALHSLEGGEATLWRLSTQIAAALPEERRRPGWLPPNDGPEPPAILAGLASLEVRDRAALLLRERLGWEDQELVTTAGAEPGPALDALVASYGEAPRERVLADLAAVTWPRPSRSESVALIRAIETAAERTAGPEAGKPPGRDVEVRRRLESVAQWLAIIVGILLVGWLTWQKLASPAPAPEPVPTAAPVPEPTPSPTPAPPPIDDPTIPLAAVTWLRNNATWISGQTLGDAIGDAHVIVIGDGTWGANGTAEFNRERLHVTRHLVEDLGFGILILQSPEPGGSVGALFRNNEEDGFRALARILAGQWATEELADALRWIRRQEGFEVAGFLPPREFNQRLQRSIESYLRQIDPENVSRMPGDSRMMLAYLEARRGVYEPQDATAYRRAISDARSQVQYDLLAASGDRGEAGGLYEQLARENLERLLDEAGERKVVVWASDLSASGLPALNDVARWLTSEPERPVVRLGFAFGEGSMQALRMPVSRRAQQMIEQRVGSPPIGTLEAFLRLAGEDTYLVDVRGLREAAGEWLAEPRPMRRSTGGYSECFPEDHYEQVALADKYDLVVYVEQVTPVTLSEKPPVAGAPPCMHAPQNLDFSRGFAPWERGGTAAVQYRAGTDPEMGRGSLRALDGSPSGTGTLFQSFRADGYRGRTIRLAGRCFVDSDRAKARLFIEAKGMNGEVLAQRRTELSRERRFPPCEAWLAVPAGATRIDVGLLLEGPGQAWMSSLAFAVED